MNTFLADLRFALRQLRGSPGFAATAIFTLAVGIGANVAIFSIVNGVLLRPLPYPDAERIVRVFHVSEGGTPGSFSEPNFHDLGERSRGFDGLAHFSTGVSSIVGGSEPVRALVATVSEEFLDVMGVGPLIGRDIAADERVEGSAGAVLVSHVFWERYLGAERELSRIVLRMGDITVSVVGVMPPDFDFPTGAALWYPREARPPTLSRTAHGRQVVGRLAAGIPFDAVQSDVSTVARQMKAEYGEDTWMSETLLIPLPQEMVSRVRSALLIITGAALVLLLIACANVANLLFARAEARRREMAVRLALGAHAGRVLRLFLSETLLLASAGGIVGVLFAIWGVGALTRLQPGNLPRVGEIGMDVRVLLFSVGISAVAALVLGASAAWRALRDDGSGLTAGRAHAGSRGGGRLQAGLVVSQVGLTVILLVGAGLLGRSLLRVMDQDLGFRTEGTLAMTVALPSSRPDLANFHDAMLDRLAAIPGVRVAGGINALPLGGGGSNGTFIKMNHPDEIQSMEDYERISDEAGRRGYAEFRVASADYLRALSVPLLEGRFFQDIDGPDAPHVALVSRSLAETGWPGESPLGKWVQFGNMDGDITPFIVVGVVGDVREASLESEPRPTFYAFHRQRPVSTGGFTYVLASEVPTAGLIAPARAALTELDPEVPPVFRTLEEVYAGALAERRFNLILLGIFGGAALFLSMLGIYGVMAFGVAQRTREIGVRMALGAARAGVVRMVVRQALVVAAVGVSVGLAGAFALTRLMEGLLFGVSALDPLTFVGIPVVLVAVALAAAWLPARRASRVDPMIALRAE